MRQNEEFKSQDENHFATIIYKNEISLIDKLLSSISEVLPDSKIHVLIINHSKKEIKRLNKASSSVVYYSLGQLPFLVNCLIRIKYYFSSERVTKGLAKPNFLLYLIGRVKQNMVFIEPYLEAKEGIAELFKKFSKNDVLLIQNNFPLSPKISENGFLENFSKGLYTSSLIGFSLNAGHVLKWWAMVSSYPSKKKRKANFHYEQSYLDLIPIKFMNVCISSRSWMVITPENERYINEYEPNRIIAQISN